VLERNSCLYRTNLRADEEPVVANLTLLLVTLAPLPAPDLFMIDRYLAAAASAGIRATLVLNKCELPWPRELASELEAYGRVGYTHLAVSTKTDVGMMQLRAACAGDIAAFVGQSGVGKSSLVGHLVPEAEIRTGELMLRTQEGTHTTTASHLYDLAGGGHLIDSPGVRDFAPALSRLEPTSLGFLEVAQRAPQCRFDDCRHLREPGCAVRTASESGDISPRRYESYRRLRRLFETLGSQDGSGRKPRPR
jgi:ribosome biogenesis GTPase